MARHQKTQIPPAIDAPKALASLMQAFCVDSEQEAQLLLEKAAYAIYGREAEPNDEFDVFKRKRIISQDELEGIIDLMKGLRPQDMLETLYAAQIVVSHMLGMRKLAQTYKEDQKLGLNLLSFSCEAMQRLQRKRGGGVQHITVNYNYNDQRSALIQQAATTALPQSSSNEFCKCLSEG